MLRAGWVGVAAHGPVKKLSVPDIHLTSVFLIWASNPYGCLRREGGSGYSGLLFLSFFPVPEEIFELVHKFLDIFELAVDRGKADISHPVQTVELLHHALPNLRTLYLPLSSFLEMELDAIHDLFNHVDADGPLLTCSLQAIEDFEAVEWLSSRVFLDDQWERILCPFACRKSFTATETFPSAPNGLFILSQTGIDDFALGMATKGAFHSVRAP